MSTTSVDTPLEQPGDRTLTERMLDRVERVGNRIPHPAMLFIWLIVIVVVVSQVMHWAGVQTTSQVAAPPPAQVHQG
jgi:aminobenzoyl-glutamate transport protein